ncbi:MAG: hypothetical protein J2P40_08315 [Candidatus Dormibacteraeota bacterium]|nr:hypothetical protein [Candidatus Dormibacteraeota bacterium]MBO0761265.1 hypothetical protein [Candidatus Dormibacteraeota bacterium]
MSEHSDSPNGKLDSPWRGLPRPKGRWFKLGEADMRRLELASARLGATPDAVFEDAFNLYLDLLAELDGNARFGIQRPHEELLQVRFKGLLSRCQVNEAAEPSQEKDGRLMDRFLHALVQRPEASL